jgi:two-component system LytT family response regulator
MPSLRTIIIDDEPAACELLEELLAALPEIAVIGSFSDPAEALQAIVAESPDLLFLDVEMPRLSGFDLLDALGDRVPPGVVFITAYDQHALAAFDVSAADYLLKPLDEGRLRRAVERATARIGSRRALTTSGATSGSSDAWRATAGGNGAGEDDALVERRRSARERDPYVTFLPVRIGDRIVLQRVSEVSWFEAQRKYVRLYTAAESHLVRHTMQGLEERLDPRQFLRVSRSAIVNVEQIRHLEPWSHGEYVLVLRTGHRVVTTHGYRDAVQRLLRGA